MILSRCYYKSSSYLVFDDLKKRVLSQYAILKTNITSTDPGVYNLTNFGNPQWFNGQH